jgi:hypothetical protein
VPLPSRQVQGNLRRIPRPDPRSPTRAEAVTPQLGAGRALRHRPAKGGWESPEGSVTLNLMPAPRHVVYARTAVVFLVLTILGAIATAVFYADHHTKRGLAAVILTVIFLVVAVGCWVASTRYRRDRRY